ncbi:MAG TPA: aminotransferase class I/II-fold pyridoxal phosphate-dependent enzyme [Candidatus Saccharimonadales bacterium]
MKYSFYDDYSEGVHSEILKYIAEHNEDQQLGYGNDEYCKLGADRLKEAFDLPQADIHFLPNGTIANVIGLVSMLKPFEGVISPDSGHINTHEAGAIEAVGHKIIWVEAPDGKLTPARIDEALARYEDEHTVKPQVVYLTQATELGTTYTRAELEEVIQHAKDKGLYTYLDGARLAMAIANKELGLTLQNFGALGLDMFYVGGTKDGGLYGEAMIIANDGLKPNFRNHMKQRGGLMAKGRFMGQQFARFFDTDNLWLTLAEHANAQATRLYMGLKELGIEFDQEPGTNQIFPIFDNGVLENLLKDYGFYKWSKVSDTKTKVRLVCSWATKPENVDEFLNDAGTLLQNK